MYKGIPDTDGLVALAKIGAATIVFGVLIGVPMVVGLILWILIRAFA